MEASTPALIRVSATSSPFKVAGAIAHSLRERSQVVVQAIGAAALNQAVKALVYARRYLNPDQIDFVVSPSFADLDIEGHTKTVVRLSVERTSLSEPANPG